MDARAAGARRAIWMRRPLVYELLLIGAALGLGLVLWAAGLALVWIWPLVLLPYVGRHLWLLFQLAWLIRRQHRLVPPFPHGLWGELFRVIARYQQRGRKGRKRQVRFTRRFREAANAIPDALAILDKQHRIEWANPAAAVLLNVHWPDDDGKRLTDILLHRNLGAFIDAAHYHQPMDVAPPHNRTLMLSLRSTPFGERKRQRLLVARDITKLYHLNMIRRDFVANASHELRTPLTVIAGFIENLADAPNTPESHRRPLSLMHKQTNRMRSIIEDLLTLSRLEMPDRDEEPRRVEVAVQIQGILDEARALSNGEHRIESELDPELCLLGQAAELRGAFANLVYNAVRHTPDGTRIRVVWTRGASGPVFRVMDNGQGIAVEHLPRLTERFYRVDPARSRDSGGTGLGLAIVKHVLNRHEARLRVVSEPGQGTTFECIFPHHRALVPHPPVARPEPARAALPLPPPRSAQVPIRHVHPQST